jgi:hypothetical protein
MHTLIFPSMTSIPSYKYANILLITKIFPPIFDMGNEFKECKSNFFSIRNVMDRKIPFYYIQPLVYTICVYLTFKYRNIEVYLYLEGGSASTRKDVSHVVSHRRICTKLSIIAFLCCVRDYSRIILKGSHVSSYFFSPTMRVRLGMREIWSSRETSSRPNSLYSELIGDMH